MTTLSFGRYGGEFCVGTINDIEKDNIIELLKRFDASLVIGNYETNFDTNDYKENFFDFNDIEHISSAVIEATIWIESDDSNIKLDYDYFSSDECKVVITDEPTLPNGYFIVSSSTEKGSFFEVKLDIPANEINPKKLTLECRDMTGLGYGDSIITNVFYDDKELEINYDSCDTMGKGYDQELIFSEDGDMFDGLELIVGNIPESEMFTVLDEINGIDEMEAKTNYMEFVEAWRHGKLLDKESLVVFASPFLYKHFEKEKVDKLWKTKMNIKFALQNGYETEIPSYIMEEVSIEFPEWLI